MRDISLVHAVKSSTSHNLAVNVVRLSLSCTFCWEYLWKIFNRRGSGTARLDPVSSASVNLQFISEDFDSRPPRNVEIAGCGPDACIANIDFDGDSVGIVGDIVSLFKGLLQDTAEGKLGSTVCNALRGLDNDDGADTMGDLRGILGGVLDVYLKPLGGVAWPIRCLWRIPWPD